MNWGSHQWHQNWWLLEKKHGSAQEGMAGGVTYLHFVKGITCDDFLWKGGTYVKDVWKQKKLSNVVDHTTYTEVPEK